MSLSYGTNTATIVVSGKQAPPWNHEERTHEESSYSKDPHTGDCRVVKFIWVELEVPAWMSNIPSPSILAWKIRAGNRVGVQRSWAVLKLSSVQHLASWACVPGCNLLLWWDMQAPMWSLHVESTWPLTKWLPWPGSYGKGCTRVLGVSVLPGGRKRENSWFSWGYNQELGFFKMTDQLPKLWWTFDSSTSFLDWQDSKARLLPLHPNVVTGIGRRRKKC